MSGPDFSCHPAVASDLEVIARVVSDNSGSDRAQEVLREFQDAMEALRKDPSRAAPRPKLGAHIHAYPAGHRGILAVTLEPHAQRLRVIAASYGGDEWL